MHGIQIIWFMNFCFGIKMNSKRKIIVGEISRESWKEYFQSRISIGNCNVTLTILCNFFQRFISPLFEKLIDKIRVKKKMAKFSYFFYDLFAKSSFEFSFSLYIPLCAPCRTIFPKTTDKIWNDISPRATSTSQFNKWQGNHKSQSWPAIPMNLPRVRVINGPFAANSSNPTRTRGVKI